MKQLEIGQRINVFKVIRSCYGTDAFKVGRLYAEKHDSEYRGNLYGADLICDTDRWESLHMNMPTDMVKVGCLVIKQLKNIG